MLAASALAGALWHFVGPAATFWAGAALAALFRGSVGRRRGTTSKTLGRMLLAAMLGSFSRDRRTSSQSRLPFDRIKLPPGFEITVFAEA